MKKRIFSLSLALILLSSLMFPLVASATYTPPQSTGSFTVDCTDVNFTGTVASGERVRLVVTLHSGALFTSSIVQSYDNFITTAGPFDVTVAWSQNPDGLAHRVALTVSTDGGATWSDLAPVDEGWLSCPPPPPPPPPPGGEGCTPGYWKNHPSAWAATGYSKADIFNIVFTVNFYNPTYTLGQAIKAKGGGLNKLARHGTAALLSAAHPDVNYPYTVAQVIAFVMAQDVDPLVAANELGCQIP